MYEAAVVLALKAFREHDCEPGLAAWLEVEVRAPGLKHATTPASVKAWLSRHGRSPAEQAEKQRLRELLGG
jgi:hypothetical protein